MKKRTQKDLIKNILENQQIIFDFLQMIIYNQHPDKKMTFTVNPDTLKFLMRKYNL